MSKGKNAKYVPVKQSNTMTYVLGGVALLVVVAVVIGGVLLLSEREGTPADRVRASLAAASPVYVAGDANATVTLDFFEDPMCPACGNLETTYGAQITQAIEGGDVQARYFMLSFLNRQSSSGDYSDRAGAALLAIAQSSMPEDQKQTAWLAAHSELFGNQPSETGAGGTSDYDNATLATMLNDASTAAGVPLPADVVATITEGRLTADSASNAAEGNTLMQEVGGTGTPTIVANGEVVDLSNTNWLPDLTGAS